MDIYQQRFTVFGDGKTVTNYPILHNFYIETTRWGIQRLTYGVTNYTTLT